MYSKIIDNDCVILCLYVDDILIFGTSLEIISSVKSFLSSKFEMKDLGEADVILGMKLIKSHEGIALSLSHSIEKMIKKFGYSNLKSVSTPFDPSFHLKKNLGDPINQLKYSQIIGSLLYVANRTRPDIAYAIGRLSRYNQNPDQSHWVALERVFQYLKGTLNLSLMFTEYPEVVEGYSDANWVTDSHDLKSTTGYLFLLGGAAIAWGSTRQTIISRSTMEAELIALDTTCNEAEWIKNLISELLLVSKPVPTISIHCDNKAVIELTNQKSINKKMNRHIRLRHKSIRQHKKNNIISLEFVKSEKNLVDQLTKGLSRSGVLESSRGMGLKPITWSPAVDTQPL